MKKFMIFLLMAFLYLGTSQARSEAPHFRDAKAPLPSWVTPTSHSFFADSKAVNAGVATISPSAPQEMGLGSTVPTVYAVSYTPEGTEAADSYLWYVNGAPTDSTGVTFNVLGYPVGTYSISCRVHTTNGTYVTSNVVILTVASDVVGTIVGPEYACQNDIVTLTAQASTTEVAVQYQWRRNGQPIVGATNPTYSFNVNALPSLPDTLAYEFDCQLVYAGCEGRYTPVHYFYVYPTPVTTVTAPMFCTGFASVTLTATANTAGTIQPYKWEWYKDGSLLATTFTNTYEVANPVAGDKYVALPIYIDFACNDLAGDTVTLEEYTATLSDITLALVSPASSPFCAGFTSFKVTDPNAAMNPIYTWYLDGVLIAGASDSIYAANMDGVGDHIMKVVASYPDSACGTKESSLNFAIDTVPTVVSVSGSLVICDGGTTPFTATAYPSSAELYWDGSATSAVSFDVAPGIHSVIAKTANGCMSDPVSFTVSSLGTDLHITASATAICQGQHVTLSADLSDHIDSNVVYTWSTGSHNSTIDVIPTAANNKYGVTASYGSCSNVDSIEIFINELPSAPTVTADKNTTLCPNDQIMFTAVSTAAASFVWYVDGVEIPGNNLDTLVLTDQISGTHYVNARIVDTNGCVSPVSLASNYTVDTLPSLLTIAGDHVICYGDSAMLIAYAYDAVSYLWSNGLDKDTIYVREGVYTVTASSTNGCSVVSDPFTVTELGPDVHISATATAVCPGAPVSLTADADGWIGNVTYTWGDGTVAPTITVTPTEDTTWYTVTSMVTSNSGYGTTERTCQRKDSIMVILFAAAADIDTVSVVSATSGDTICFGSQLTLKAEPDTLSAYRWFQDGIEIPGNNLDTITIVPEVGVHTYAVQAINQFGCETTQHALSTPILVLPNPSLVITGDPLICNDSLIRLYANINDTTNSTAGDALYNYEWRVYNYTIDTSASSQTITNTYTGETFTINPLAANSAVFESYFPHQDHPYIFTVNATNANGCVATSDPYYVYVADTIFVAVTLDYDSVCPGGEVTAIAHLGNYHTPDLTFQWFKNDSLIPYATEPWFTSSVDEDPTIFRVEVSQSTTGCFATGADTAHFLIPKVVTAAVAINGTRDDDPLEVCEGAQIVVTAYIDTIVDSTLTYVWKENGFWMPLVTGPSFAKQMWILDHDSANYVYEVYAVVDVPGCLPVPVASNRVHVRRNPIVLIEGVHNVCYHEGSSDPNVILSALTDGTIDLDATYNWYRNGSLVYSSGLILNMLQETIEPTNLDPVVYMVEVNNGDGCTAFSEPFPVEVYAAPVVNILASDTLICEGGVVNLEASINNYNDPMLTYQWYENTTSPVGLLPGRTHATETFTLNATTDYIVKVTHLLNDLTLSYGCVDFDTVTVTVNPDPVLTITSDLPASKTLCDGRSVTFNATVTPGVDTVGIYTWFRNGEIIPNAVGAQFTETPHALNDYPTTYIYEVSILQPTTGCESVVTLADTVTVNPNPTLAIETDPIVCRADADNIMMIAHVYPEPTTPYTFTWFEDNAALDTTYATGEHMDTITLTREYRDYAYNFSISLVNEYGCQATAETQIYVDTLPVINITATETEICVGGEITLTANLDNWNTPNMEFHWYDNGTLIPGATSITYTVVPELGTHNYTFSAKQLNSLCYATSNTVIVTVNADPTLTIDNDLPASKTLCDGRSVTFHAHVAGGVTGGEVFTWYRNGEVIPNAVDSIYTETPHAVSDYPTIYVYEVSVKQTAAGCESTVYFADSVTVNPNPTLAIETDPIVCRNGSDNIMMVAHVYPAPTTPYTFTWYEDNAVITGSTGAHLDTIVLSREYRDYPYNFSISLVNEYGCQATAETQIYVDTVPVVNIQVTENLICIGGEITLTANLNNWNTPNMEFHWYDNGTLIPGATSLTYTVAPELGNHVYTFTAEQLNSHCFATSNALTVNVIPDPIIANVSMSDTIVCQGAQIAITANPDNYVPSTDDIYTWYRNGVLMPGATAQTIYDSPVTVDNNTQQYIYTAVVTRTPSGCTSLPVASAALTIYPNPRVVITGDQYICETDSVFLIANVDTIGRNVGTLHYTWYESGMIRDNMAYNFGDNQMYSEYWYPRTEPYRFTVEVQREGVPAACASTSAEYLVYVYPRPIVNITATETEICEGGEVTLTANLVDPNQVNMIYQWFEIRNRVDSFATGYDAAGNLVYTTYPVSYRYYIPGANSSTYTSVYDHTVTMGVQVTQTHSLCSEYDEIVITVNPIPVVTDVTVNNQHIDTVCDGAQVDLACTITPADAQGAVYTWYRNGIEIPGANQSTFSENVYTTDNHVTVNVYTVKVELPASGCISEVSVPNATVIINPAPTMVSVSGVNVICENDSTTLTVYSDVQGTITWSTGSHEPTITVPAGVYTVTVTTPEGCEMTSNPFTVEALGTDLLVSASETHICAGEHTTLYVNQDGWAGNVTYQWDANAGNSTATTVDVAPEVTTTYHVTATVTSTNGVCQATGEVTIVVTPLPVKLTVAATAAAVCEGDQVTFTATPYDPTYTYIWYQNGIEIIGEHQNVITVNFPIEGTYTFAAKAVNDQGCVSAEASDPVAVVVNAAPDAVVISGNLEICNGGFTTLYANVTPNTAGATYQWYLNNVAIAGANGYFLTVAAAGSYKVDVTTNGCTTTSDAVNVIVNEAPQLQLTATETTICQYGTTVITAEATGWNNADVNYTWSNGYQGSSFTFTPAVAGDYTFSVTASQSTSGCNAVDQITIHVNAGPGAPVMSVNTNHSVICQGAQVILTMTDTNTVNYGNPTITWFDNGIMMAGNHSSVTITPAIGVHSYNVVVEYPNSGCNTAISEPIVVTVNPVPTVVVELTSGNNNVLCDGGSTTLTANVNPAGYPYTYQWYLNNVAINNANGSTLDVTLPAREQSYDYQVLVSGAPGCEVLSDVTSIVVVADPVVVASVDNNVICEGGQATFSVSVDGGVANVNGLNGYSFAWYSNTNNTTPIATTPTFTVNNATAGLYAYRVVVTSPYGCETTSNIVNLSVVQDPTVTVAVAAGYDATICENGSTMLVANVTGGYGTPSYQWYSNGLPMLGETNQTLVLNNVTNNNFVYTVKVTQTGVDCEAVSTNTMNPFTVVAPYVITVTGNQNTCVGGTVTLTSAVTGVLAGDVPTYQWYRVSENGVATPIANANNPVYTTEPLLMAGQYEYFVQVTSSISGCSNNSDSYTANVIADPTVVINGAHAVCEQGQLQLNATVTGGIPGVQYTYTWSWTGASTGSATTAVPYYTPNLPANDGANHYYFRVTINPVGTSGCDATSAAHELDVYAVPAVVVTADRAYVCQGGDVTFTANVTPAGNYNYAWTINGVSVASNQPSVTTTVNNAGPVTATVTVSANNNLVSCAATATIAVPVQVVADPVVTIAANHTSMCAGGTTTLSINNITANNNIPTNYSYQWAVNGQEIPGAINNTFNQTINAAGTYVYTLRLTQNDALGCISDWSAPVTVLVAEQPSVTLYNADGLNICEGGTIDLNAVVNNYGNTIDGVLNSSVYGPMTYSWTSAGNVVANHPNLTSGTDQLSQTLNTVGNYSYSVIVNPTGYACQPAASEVVTVSVANDPTWTDVHVYYPDMCVGDQVNLIANIVGGVADYMGNTNGYIQWTVTYNGVTSNVSGGQGGTTYDIPTLAGNYVYTPTFVGNMGSGCQLTNTAAVQQPVLVHEIPTAAFVSGDGSTICANDPDASVELTIAFTGGAPYTFDIENMMTGEILPYHVSLTDTFRFYVSPDMTTRYRIIMLANAYCQNDQISTASTSEVTVNVVSVEFVETTFMPVNCGDDVVIDFNIVSGNQNANYVVYENGSAIASGTVVANQVVIPDGLLSEGAHHLTLVIDGCSFDITVVIPVNSESSDIFGDNLMEIRWDDVAIINLNANPRYNFVGFQWYRNNVLIPGAIYKNYQEVGGLNGYYSVELTVIDTQTGETLTFITCPRLFNTVSGMKVYPVPANIEQVVTVEFDMTAEELNGAVLDIFDATGKLINHITDLKPVTRVAGFKAQGTYFGRIITGTNEIKTVKFIIVK